MTAGPPLLPIKMRLLDAAVERLQPRSFADLGAVWNVNGGYTFYLLESIEVDHAFLVDEGVNAPTRRRAEGFPQLELLEANFGTEEVRDRIGTVDLLIMFDTLLHQVAPDWDEVLRLYAPSTRAFAIVNPQYIGADSTTRLLDLGRERYLAAVPPVAPHREVFERMYEVVPEKGRIYRDVHSIWQWGILDSDLRAEMDALGFELVYYENGGPWGKRLPFLHATGKQFENCAYLFLKQE